MAKRGTKNSVGELSVEVSADVSGAVGGLKQVRQEFDNAAAAAESMPGRVTPATEAYAQAVNKAGDDVVSSFKRQVSAVTEFLGRITAVVGIWTTFYNIGTRIGEMLFDNATKAEKFLHALGGSAGKDAAANVKAIEDEILKVEHSLRQAMNAGIDKLAPSDLTRGLLELYYGDPDEMRRRLESLRASERSFRQQDRAFHEQQAKERAAKSAAAEAEAAKKAAEAESAAKDKVFDDAERRARDLEIQQLEGIDRINAEEKRALEEVQKMADQARGRDSGDFEKAERLAKAIQADAARRRAEWHEQKQAEEDRERKRREADEKAAEKAAEMMRKAMQSALDDFARQQRQFTDNITERISADVRRIAQLIDLRAGRRGGL